MPAARGVGHWVFSGVAWAALGGLFALRWLTEPDPRGHGTHEQLGLPACTMIDLVGIPCPGCGVTTALSLCARGELAAAAAVQPFGALLALAIALAALFALGATLLGRDAWSDLRRAWRRWMPWAAAGALLAAWAWKIAALRA